MELVKVILFFLACILTFAPLVVLAQVDSYEFPPGFKCVAGGGNFTANSTFAGNLNSLVSSLSSLKSNPYGFYNLSSGDPSEETAYAIALCRREVRRDDCLSCIQTAASNLTEQCPGTKKAVVWYTHCMFRYSNRTIYGRKETNPTLAFIGGVEISKSREEFERLQRELLNRLKGIAAAGGPNRKYAQGNGSASPGYRTFYATAHCTPDLSEQDCNDCLVIGFESIPSCCDGQIGLRWFCPSCAFRFETGRFYEFDADLEPDPPAIQPADAPTTASRNEKTGKDKGGSKVIIAIVIPVVLVALFLVCFCFVLKNKREHREGIKALGKLLWSGSNTEDDFSHTDSFQVDFAILKFATNNFSSENEIGRGGFGPVYKGAFSDEQEVAVKRLSETSTQGENEFKKEVSLLAKLQHRNLVRLLGCCVEGKERILVYEFIKNASLDHFIFDSGKHERPDWKTCYKIIEGIAKGLLYLHEDSVLRIIHRDLKPSNILLDQEMNPKIADFGLAKLYNTEQTATHEIASKVAGTFGYMAPEYLKYGKMSVKTDVFSFGVIVIEIITGKKRNSSSTDENEEDLLSWVWRSWIEENIESVIHPSLKTESGSRVEMLKCIRIGLSCVQESAASRPTMAAVSLMLNSNSYIFPTLSRPGFVLESERDSNVSSSSDRASEGLLASFNSVTVSQLNPR